MLEIDGSIGEGGGQVLRTALSVSCVLRKPVRIRNIRAGRGQPGLRPQHLAVCNMLAKLCGAKMEGAAIGSSEVVFEPGEMMGGRHEFDIGTAGSCTLFLQAALPVLLCSGEKCSLLVKGGTHVRGAPTFEYFSEVFLPAARRFGVNAEAKMLRAGFYPKGGGEVLLEAAPSSLSGAAFSAEPGNKASYRIISFGIPQHVAEREEKTLREKLAGFEISGEAIDAPASCAGNAITVWKGAIGASSLGERRKKAEDVAAEACDLFLKECGTGDRKAEAGLHNSECGTGTLAAYVDSRLADQLLIYAALARGESRYRTPEMTGHLKTNAKVLCSMTGRNIILGSDGSVGVI
ncbi:MAG: RNA 3'-terminal phosphate cyclase [Candidatus Micrarchaeia archaeon]